MREVAASTPRRWFVAALVLSAAVGALVAQASIEPRAPQTPAAQRPIRPPPARPAPGAPRRVASRTKSTSSPADGGDSGATRADAAERANGSSTSGDAPLTPSQGEANFVDEFAGAADWKVLYEPSDDLRESLIPSPKLLAMLARDNEAAAGVVSSLGPAPWIDATFQASGFADAPVTVLGRDFRARASPAASAAWHAERARVPVDDRRVAAATERLARFESERSELLARVFDRVVNLARRHEDPDVTAYFVAVDGIRLFRASENPGVAGLAAERRRLDDALRRRAEEVCE